MSVNAVSQGPRVEIAARKIKRQDAFGGEWHDLPLVAESLSCLEAGRSSLTCELEIVVWLCVMVRAGTALGTSRSKARVRRAGWHGDNGG